MFVSIDVATKQEKRLRFGVRSASEYRDVVIADAQLFRDLGDLAVAPGLVRVELLLVVLITNVCE